jgi:hypothetical protein
MPRAPKTDKALSVGTTIAPAVAAIVRERATARGVRVSEVLRELILRGLDLDPVTDDERRTATAIRALRGRGTAASTHGGAGAASLRRAA